MADTFEIEDEIKSTILDFCAFLGCLSEIPNTQEEIAGLWLAAVQCHAMAMEVTIHG